MRKAAIYVRAGSKKVVSAQQRFLESLQYAVTCHYLDNLKERQAQGRMRGVQRKAVPRLKGSPKQQISASKKKIARG